MDHKLRLTKHRIGQRSDYINYIVAGPNKSYTETHMAYCGSTQFMRQSLQKQHWSVASQTI